MRQGLTTLPDWKRLGMNVTAVANGREALEEIDRNRPQILITDLRMPIMDGIELIEKIRLTDPHMRILILTCLDDFKFTKRALELGVSDYILKLTADVDEIEDALFKIRQSLDEDNTAMEHSHKSNGQQFKERILKDYICREIMTADEFCKSAQSLSLCFSSKQICLVRMKFPMDNAPVNQGIPMERVMSFLLSLIDAILTLYGHGEVFSDSVENVVLIFSFGDLSISDALDLKTKILTEAEHSVCHYLGVPAYIGISGFINGYKFLPQLYREAGEALQRETNILGNPKLSAVIGFLQENFRRDISLGDAADFAGVTPNYLSKIFLQSGLGSFTTVLNEIRVSCAKTLLHDFSYTVYRVGEQVGFQNATYFIRVFKKHTGVTPNEYRIQPKGEWE